VPGTISFPILVHSSTQDHTSVLACHQLKTCCHKHIIIIIIKLIYTITRYRSPTINMITGVKPDSDHVGYISDKPNCCQLCSSSQSAETAITFRQASGYLSSCTASLPFDQYQTTVLGDKGTYVNNFLDLLHFGTITTSQKVYMTANLPF